MLVGGSVFCDSSEYEEVATFNSVEQAQAYIEAEYADEHKKDPFQFHEVNDLELFIINGMECYYDDAEYDDISGHYAATMLLANNDDKHYNRLLREFYAVAEFNNYEIAKKHQNQILFYFGFFKNDDYCDEEYWEEPPLPNLKKSIASLRKILDEMEQEVAKEVEKK